MHPHTPHSSDATAPETPLTQRKLARRVTLVNGIGVLFILGLAAVVLAADFLGQRAFADVRVPVGVVTSLVGAPYLLWLLARDNRSRGSA